jgi:hypothetical protein
MQKHIALLDFCFYFAILHVVEVVDQKQMANCTTGAPVSKLKEHKYNAFMKLNLSRNPYVSGEGHIHQRTGIEFWRTELDNKKNTNRLEEYMMPTEDEVAVAKPRKRLKQGS